MKKSIVLAGLVLLVNTAFGQFSLSGDVLIRSEYRHGYRRMPLPEEEAAAFVGQRSRLILDFKADRVTTKISFQDVRFWGQEEQRVQRPSLDLHEAWVQLAITDSLLLRAGRQEIRFENQRFFGVNDWIFPGQKHDALYLRHIGPRSELHVAAAFNQSAPRLFETDYRVNNYKTLNYVYYRTRIGDNITMSLMGVADGFQNPDNPEINYVRGTWIPYFEYRTERLLFTLNPAFQHGRTRLGAEINAWYLMGSVTANINPKVLSTLGVEVFSGNNALDPSPTERGFDFLYGAAHGFLGYMDYFTQMPLDARGAGLVSPHIRTEYRFNPKTRLDLDLHVFFLQNNFLHQGVAINKYLGAEIDAKFYYSFNDITQVAFGYSAMFGSDSMEIIKGGRNEEFAHWAFVMLRFRPKFL
ncbi:MAG TPA: alginate export family protein [Bacteroidales bacterium]|nr:alginate export family protein [Bacteroidales bacterium]